MTTAMTISIALGLLVLAAGPLEANPPIVVSGAVKRADGGGPVEGASIRIKAVALPGAAVLATATTGKDGRFQVDVPARRGFVCEAIAPGLASQQVSRKTSDPSCDFELESQLTLSHVIRQTPLQGRGPGLSLVATTSSTLYLRLLTIRLHLTKPASCGSSGTTLQYDLGGMVAVSLGHVTSTVASAGRQFHVTGTAPLRACEETEISLHLEPADKLEAGDTPILLTLPRTLTLKRDASLRQMKLAELGVKSTYRTTIDRIDVELVTSRENKASAQLSGLSIPVSMDQ